MQHNWGHLCHSALHIFADTKLPVLVRTKGYQGLGLFRYSVAVALEGASCRSVTCPGLRGYTPDFLKPLITLIAVKEFGQASATSDANLSVVITLPGCLPRYLLQALEKLLLNDLNTPTSSGCNI